MRHLAEAKAKLILFGEHAAVNGYPALGISLPWKVSITLGTDPVSMKDENLKGILDKIHELFPEMDNVSPLSLSVQSDVPIGTGFGSSGALCVALAKAVYAWLEQTPDQQTIWKTAHKLEMVFHESPSGVDTGISLHENICYFEKDADQPLPYCHVLSIDPLYLIIGAVERHSNTKTLVSNLQKKRKEDPETAKYIESLGLLSQAAAAALIKNDSNTLAQHANAAHVLLTALELSTESQNKMIDFGISKGALGGKLSGAGGGGAYFLITKNAAEAENIAQQMRLFAEQQKILHLVAPIPYPIGTVSGSIPKTR